MTSTLSVDLRLNKRPDEAVEGTRSLLLFVGGTWHLEPAVRSHPWTASGHNR